MKRSISDRFFVNDQPGNYEHGLDIGFARGQWCAAACLVDVADICHGCLPPIENSRLKRLFGGQRPYLSPSCPVRLAVSGVA
jgi:hypothetical protein